MFRPLTLAALLLAAAGVGRAADDKIAYKVYPDYFVSNKVVLKDSVVCAVATTRDQFDEIFKPRPPLLGGKKSVLIPKDAFNKGQIAATVIKEGNAITTYTVEKVMGKDGVVTLAYKAESKGKGSAARFRSPLIVTFPGKGVKSVEFVENGKKVATVKVDK